MSQEAAPERAVPEQSAAQSVPEQKTSGAPKGLLQQMEELMAALSADLSQLDADLQSSADRNEPEQHDREPHQAAPLDRTGPHDHPAPHRGEDDEHGGNGRFQHGGPGTAL
ncbi:hypothetical protein AB0424_15060 [Streptomyces sp. NPDC051180]|uniref:hypothetical protein n=1 Tax=Streptomyces sp. NPDC051180 TaxID=3155797 RepID=UPI00344C7952